MIRHIIFIASSYKLGKQIAWHYAAETISQDFLKHLHDSSKARVGKSNYSIHKLSTDSKTWSSVVEKDSFFADFYLYEDFEEFLDVIVEDKKISALDISKYLLSWKPMTNLKLQKMIYLVYADYLLKTGKSLFDEKIIAMQYGPLIKEVYDVYKVHGRDEIELDDTKTLVLEDITMPMVVARFLQTDDSKSILQSLDETIEKFGSKTASQLVDITHRPGSPWSETAELRKEITDDVILAYHHIEVA